jgi:Tol biopolymer transport system component
MAHRYEQADQARREAEQQLRERDAKQERGELRKELLGAFLGEEYWVGPGLGTDLVVMGLPYRLLLPDDVALRYELRPDHEQLLSVSADGRDRREVLETFNIFSYPTVSADGGSVALVLDHRQWSKALVVVSLADGSVRELVAHRSHYYSSPVISPDGRRVVFWSSSSRDADKSLEVIGSDGSERRVLVAAPWSRMDQPQWLPDSRAVVLSLKGSDDVTASAWQIDVASGERILLAGASSAVASFLRPAVAPNGSFLAVVEEGTEGMWLGRIELSDRSYQRLVEAPVGRVSIAPDSSRIAFETAPTRDPEDARKDDLELGLVAASGGALRLLTRNEIDDSLAGWSRDGRRLYFQQGGGDPDGKHRNHRIYWVEP